MNKYKNTRFSIILPLVISLSIIVGILIAEVLNKGNLYQGILFPQKQDKLNIVIDYVTNEYVDEVDRNSLAEIAIPKFLEALDPHTVYFSADEAKAVEEELLGEFDGIGVQFNIFRDTVLVVNVIVGGPSEKTGLKGGDRIIMVNDSIADEVQRIHQLKEKPIVVRNTPNYWTIDKNVCRKRKQEFIDELGVPEDIFFVMYHGGVKAGRGIENLLMAIQKNKKIAGVILGNGEAAYKEKLKKLVKKLQISDRVLFHRAVDIDILWQYVGAADIGMITIPAVCKSYYYMLPNKFFENIQSLTPMIGSDFPEIRRIILKYEIGLLVNPEKIDEIAEAIEKMRVDKKMYSKFKNNLVEIKKDLCWENERKILEEAYGKFLR
jgi:glycosyltransferase involved in cell wall biosynthesis